MPSSANSPHLSRDFCEIFLSQFQMLHQIGQLRPSPGQLATFSQEEHVQNLFLPCWIYCNTGVMFTIKSEKRT